ncbi:hypothetical protein D917_04851 [Trichinella nativa]|uniref:Uncharacterized protein n=1 Tax=Trichinella nativa TaxID=6335 RepID=A0A1Y3F1L8_9BILA|nr:hypothetical protein D917_04851 [Trichinella nativa]
MFLQSQKLYENHKAYIAKPAYLSVCQLQKCTVGCKTWNTGKYPNMATYT